MTNFKSGSIFHVTASVAHSVARVSLSMVETARATLALYTNVKCPGCQRVVIAWPGAGANLEVRMVRDVTERSGRGPALNCKRCGQLLELVAHR